MASKLTITLRSASTEAQLRANVLGNSTDPRAQLETFKNFLAGLNGGSNAATLDIPLGSTSATITATVATTGASSLTINGGTLTANSNYAVSGLTTTAAAANLAAAVNASTNGNIQLVTATSSGNVVTLKSKYPGLVGNLIPVSGTGALSAVTGHMSGGTSGTTRILAFNTSTGSVI